MCKWKSKYDFSYNRCTEDPLPGDQHNHCILHSRKDDKDPEAFKQAVEKRLGAGGHSERSEESRPFAVAQGDTLGPGLKDELEVDGSVRHSERSEESPSGQEVEKRLETGDKEIDLRGCYFPRGSDKRYFVGYQFNKPVDFTGATFTEGVSFSMATFTRWADFSEAKFTEEADFRVATFKEADFVTTRFEKGAIFDQAEFRDRVFFVSMVLWPEKKEVKAYLGPGSSFNNVRFLGEVRFQRVNLSNCSFLHSNIDRVDFRYCEFAEAKGRKNVLRDELEADGGRGHVATCPYIPRGE